MASLFNSIKNYFRQARDDAAESLADPVRDGKFAIEDATKQERQFRTEVANLIASIKEQAKDLVAVQGQEQKFDRIAKIAAANFKAGDKSAESDVRDAASKVQQARSRIAELQKQIEQSRAIEANLRTQLDNVRNKIARAEQNHATLSARHKSAQIRRSLSAAAAKISQGGGGLSALDDLEKAVNKEEAHAEAYEEMAVASASSLEDKYAGATAGGSLADEYLR